MWTTARAILIMAKSLLQLSPHNINHLKYSSSDISRGLLPSVCLSRWSFAGKQRSSRSSCISQTSTAEVKILRDTNMMMTKFPLNWSLVNEAALSPAVVSIHTPSCLQISTAVFYVHLRLSLSLSFLVSPQRGINLTYNHPPHILPTHLNAHWSLSTVS